jgi:hypothetical protein
MISVIKQIRLIALTCVLVLPGAALAQDSKNQSKSESNSVMDH